MEIDRELLVRMLDKQEELNKLIHPDWRGQGYNWQRAILVECVEGMEHYGWKWWKKQNPDLDQVTLEAVDLWHFILSYYLHDNMDTEAIANHIIYHNFPEAEVTGQDTVVHKFEALAYSRGVLMVPKLLSILESLDVTFEQLYLLYIGKNVLNIFRQNNGYKDGTYIKNWFGWEDNVYLMRSGIADIDTNISLLELEATIMNRLDNAYSIVLNTEYKGRTRNLVEEILILSVEYGLDPYIVWDAELNFTIPLMSGSNSAVGTVITEDNFDYLKTCLQEIPNLNEAVTTWRSISGNSKRVKPN